jgi:hypothetical protein
MWYATYTHVIQNDSRFLVIENQVGTLIPGFSFGHNLCYKYSNESCKPILDMYVSKYFQWYKEFFNPMSFDLWNRSLKNSKLCRDFNFQSGNPLGSVWVHPLTLSNTPRSVNVIPGLHFRPTPFHALNVFPLLPNIINPKFSEKFNDFNYSLVILAYI